MAGQLLGLIRDKNATLETALAGLDQLAPGCGLEQMGEPAEARALLDGLGGARRARAAQAAAEAGIEARLAALGQRARGRAPAAPSGWRGSRRAATPGSRRRFARLAPLEARLAALEGATPRRAAEKSSDAEARAEREALKRLEARLEAQRPRRFRRARALKARLRAARHSDPPQKEALAGRRPRRRLEEALAAHDPRRGLERLADGWPRSRPRGASPRSPSS